MAIAKFIELSPHQTIYLEKNHIESVARSLEAQTPHIENYNNLILTPDTFYISRLIRVEELLTQLEDTHLEGYRIYKRGSKLFSIFRSQGKITRSLEISDPQIIYSDFMKNLISTYDRLLWPLNTPDTAYYLEPETIKNLLLGSLTPAQKPALTPKLDISHEAKTFDYAKSFKFPEPTPYGELHLKKGPDGFEVTHCGERGEVEYQIIDQNLNNLILAYTKRVYAISEHPIPVLYNPES